MPNRILKETICTSETLDQLTTEAENLFYRLLVQCDDFGRMDARPAIIRAKCYPLKVDSITNDQLRQWLVLLVDVELIKIYRVEGKEYLQMLTWHKHQQVRASKSKYPEPNGSCNQLLADDINCKQPLADVLVLEDVIDIRESIYDTRETRDDKRNNGSGEPFILPDWIDSNVWEAFMEFRKKQKALPSNHAKMLLIDKLAKLKSSGNDPNEVLNQSIMNNWKGLFPLKDFDTKTEKQVVTNPDKFTKGRYSNNAVRSTEDYEMVLQERQRRNKQK